MTDLHPSCPDWAGQQVRCDRCGQEYTCTPWADFYCAAEGDHCCEPCLLGGRPLVVIDEETTAGLIRGEQP